MRYSIRMDYDGGGAGHAVGDTWWDVAYGCHDHRKQPQKQTKSCLAGELPTRLTSPEEQRSGMPPRQTNRERYRECQPRVGTHTKAPASRTGSQP